MTYDINVSHRAPPPVVPLAQVIAFGGAAATVHPATGYQLCRMLASSTDVASTIDAELSRADFTPDAASAAAYATLWPPQLRYQRDFQVFGGEFLGDQPVDKLRGFFDAFFQLDAAVWGGFLAGCARTLHVARRLL